MAKKLHIAIDGPVAAGKGTVASLVAKKLGIMYAETGAMYRTVALMGAKEGVDLSDEQKLLDLLKKHTLELSVSENRPGKCEVFLDGENVTDAIRAPEVSRNSSVVAAHPGVRAFLVEKQKKIAKGSSVVMEGRDIGSVVLPNADVKVFLTANPAERAKRRQLQLRDKGVELPFDQILTETKKRDEQDTTRQVDPLQVAHGAIVIDTTELSIEQVVEKIINLVYPSQSKLFRA